MLGVINGDYGTSYMALSSATYGMRTASDARFAGAQSARVNGYRGTTQAAQYLMQV